MLWRRDAVGAAAAPLLWLREFASPPAAAPAAAPAPAVAFADGGRRRVSTPPYRSPPRGRRPRPVVAHTHRLEFPRAGRAARASRRHRVAGLRSPRRQQAKFESTSLYHPTRPGGGRYRCCSSSEPPTRSPRSRRRRVPGRGARRLSLQGRALDDAAASAARDGAPPSRPPPGWHRCTLTADEPGGRPRSRRDRREGDRYRGFKGGRMGRAAPPVGAIPDQFIYGAPALLGVGEDSPYFA